MRPQKPIYAAQSSGVLREQVQGFLRDLFGYLEARLELLGIEGRQAAHTITWAAIAAGAVLIFAGLAWLAACAAALLLMINQWGPRAAMPGLLGLVAFHFVLMLAALRLLLSRLRAGRFFDVTRREFAQDANWLASGTSHKRDRQT